MRLATASGIAPSRPRPTSMRSLRSFFATTSRTPSSTRVRPSFHASNTRIANCSITSGWVVGTIRTATWLPLRASKSASFASSPARWSAASVLVRSVTRVLSAGTATSAASHCGRSDNAAASSARDARREIMVWLFAEIHLGRLADFLLVLDGELRLFLVAEQHRRQIGRELAHGRVVFLDRLDIAVTRDRDAVFGTFQLGLQVAEVGIRLELRIVLRHHQEPRQRRRQFALRLLEPRESLRIVHELGRGLYRAHFRAGIGDAQQDLLLLARKAFHRFDEVGNEIGAALVLVHHLRPRRLDA